MDKTIEIVVVAMVTLLVASILLFIVQDRTTSYSDFLGNQQEGAQCELWKTQGKCEKMSEESCSDELVAECNGEDTTAAPSGSNDESTSTDDSSGDDAGSPFPGS